MKTRYSVVGLGKLGASMAAAIAGRGFDVIGMDTDRRAVEMLNAGQAPVQETGLEKMIQENRDRLRATLDYREIIHHSDVTFIVVPTPSDERGAFSLEYAAQAFHGIGRALAEKSEYHNVVLTSTVLPGSTRYGLLPMLEQASGKTCGADFGLCYGPEFIALGSVIHDFLNPDFNLVGEFDTRSGDQLEVCYAEIMENAPPCQRMSIENAELAKVALNTFVTIKITFANMLADLCERIPGGDVDAVTDALGLDRRIGCRYLTGALGYGGPCFPRDNVALGFLARELGTQAALAEVTDQVNRALPERLVERLSGMVREATTVAVLGLAYKPFSHVVEESQGLYLAQSLAEAGFRVVAYDPLAGKTARDVLSDRVEILDSVADCLNQADMVLITTPDPAFRALTASDFQECTVVDFWRTLDDELAGKPGIHYVPIGRSVDDAKHAVRLAGIWEQAE
jgi:UDPglucose 6-dehydrogenase